MPVVDQDQEHLRILTICNYVFAGLAAFFGCIPILHLTIGILALTGHLPVNKASDFPQMLFGLLFTIIGGFLVLSGWTLAICSVLAGRFLARRKHCVFCMIVAGVQCMWVPIGTALGVFTLIVLLRPQVKAMFKG